MKAVIFAAGLGTRLYPLTKDKPKALVKIDDRTLLELAILRLQKFGINEFVINIHHFANDVLKYLKEKQYFNAKITISDESDLLLDTGGGLLNMKYHLLEDDFIIYNVDILSDIDLSAMLDFHQKTNSIATLAIRNRETRRYFLFDDNFQMRGWENINSNEIKYTSNLKTGLNRFAFSGIHIVNPKIFKYVFNDKVFSIISWYLDLAKTQKISGFDHSESFWLDAGKISTLNEMKRNIGNLKFL